MIEGHHQLYYYTYHQGLRHTVVDKCQIESMQLKISGKPTYDRVSSEHKYLLCRISRFFCESGKTHEQHAVKQRLTFLKPMMKYAILSRIVNFGFVGIQPYAKLNTILKLFA